MSLRKKLAVLFYIIGARMTFVIACLDIGIDQARIDYQTGLDIIKRAPEL